MFSNTLYCSGLLIAASLLTACSDKDKETKKSTDFATGAIEAHYSVEVSEEHKVIYRANFVNDSNSLNLEDGDVISISAERSENIALNESISNGVATYSLVRTEIGDPVRPFFDFTRTSQEDAKNSVVIIPKGFILSSPTKDTPDFSPEGNQFTITWINSDNTTPAADINEEFTLRYDFTCRNSSGSSDIQGSVVEKPVDTGSHNISLAEVLGEGSYTFCSQFDIVAIRSDAKSGSLVQPIIRGSVVGSQVRAIKGSLSGLTLP